MSILENLPKEELSLQKHINSKKELNHYYIENFKNMKQGLILLLAIVMIASCKSKVEPNTSAEAQEASENGKYQSFGEVITDEEAISYDEMLKKLEVDSVYEGKVMGNVEAVCQAKGCWMNIVSDNSDEEMFVKFKDYGFFMPKDIAGKQVIMRGRAFKETTPVEELRHYAEDEGKSAEEIAAITEPVEELKFMADGVLLVND